MSLAQAARLSLILLVPLLAPLLVPRPIAAEDLARAYRGEADQLIRAALASDEAWGKIIYLCDRIGHRLSGSPSLAAAVDWAEEQMKLDGLESVRRQAVRVPHWERGEESATLVAPVRRELAMLGLGRSVGTPPEGITAPVVVAGDWDAFHALGAAAIQGKIVLFNAPFTTYSETVTYRWKGAHEAAERGAVAALVRSVAPRSLRNPHTGAMKRYEPEARKIPAAAISVEDALMIERLASSGEEVRVHLEMSARTLPDAESHNVLGEIVGRELAEEIVVIGGHLDSWDVGQGALDDGGGCVVAMEALRLIQELGLRPRRTVRVVLWTNEENGTAGAKAYRASPDGDPERHFAAIESDGGVESPWGFGVSVWKDESEEVDEERQARVLGTIRDVGRLLARIDADSVRTGGGGADIAPLMRGRVPGLALRASMDLYWDVHHSDADTVDKIEPRALRRNVAAMAVMTYVLAEMPGNLD